jgi:hypothetical protein
VWIVADLGVPKNLSTIKIWNFQWNSNGTTDLSNRGISQFDVLVRNTEADTDDGTTDGTPINLDNPVDDATNALDNDVVFNLGTSNPWTVALENQALAKAPNTDTYIGQSFSLPDGTTARFIAIRVDSYYGGGGIGIGKVRIEDASVTDTNPPTLLTTNPAADASGVVVNTNLVANFSENVQAGTGSITIKRTSDNSVVESFNVATSPQLTFVGSQVTIDPTANLVVGTEYYVQIDTTAIKDPANNAYAGIVNPDTTSWSFTTDGTAPLLIATSPTGDASGVVVNTNLVATFDESIQAGTGFITIKRTSDNSVVESFNVATSSQLTFAAAQVTIDPTAILPAGIGFYVQIDVGAIIDLSGNSYHGMVDPDTTTWSFSTDGTAPVPSSFSPATPTKAEPGTRLLVQFDEPVQAGTGSVTVHKASDSSVVETIDVTTPGAVAINGKVAAIVRAVALDPNTAYYVNASAGAIQDASGNPASAITGTSAWAFTTTTATPLVVGNFSGSGASLDGTTADTFAAVITTAGGSPTWDAATGFLENGAVSGGRSAAYLNIGTFLNDTKGTAAGKFELTMTIGETTGSWISLGFGAENTPNILKDFTNTGTGTGPTNGVATIIYRAQNASPAGELDMFGGPVGTNVIDGPDAQTGFRTLTVALDLTPTGGYDGTANFGKATWYDSASGAPLGSHTYTAEPNFGSILITRSASTTGTINALALYQTGTVGNTFASWISGFSVGGLTGANDDFDKDGLGNAVENLFGTSPEVFSPGLTSISSIGGNLVFRHTLSTTPALDLTGSYEWSTDLVTWNADEASAGGTTVTFADPMVITPGTPDLVEVTATVSGTPVSKVFARFKAVHN